MNEAQNEALVVSPLSRQGTRKAVVKNGTFQGLSSTHEPVYGVWVKAAPSHQLCGLRVVRAQQRDAYVTLKSGPRRLCPPERITHEALIIHE